MLNYTKARLRSAKTCWTVRSTFDRSLCDSHLRAAFHDGLDFVSVHETLIEDLKSVLATVRARQSLEMQVETIAQNKAGNLNANRKAFYNVSIPLLSIHDMRHDAHIGI